MRSLIIGASLTVMLAVVPVYATESQDQTEKPPQAEPAKPASDPGRQTKRSPRTSKRQPPSPAHESVEQGRTSRDAGPIAQQLTFSTNVLAGYDSNLAAGFGSGAGIVPAAIDSGSTAFLDATLDYFRGTPSRSIRIESTGDLRAYPDYLDHPAAGGFLLADAKTTVGPKVTISGSQRVGYEPLFSVFSPVASGAALPAAAGETVPDAGLFERRSVRSDTTLSLARQWNRRDSTSFAYSYRRQRFTEDDDPLDNRSQEVAADYRTRPARGTLIHAQYRFLNGEYTDATALTRPRREHRIEAGSEFTRTLSRRRQFTLSLSAGAGYLESITSAGREPYHSWIPVGSASANLAVSPRWSLGGGYQRSFSLLQGITDDVYATDTAYLTTGGVVTDRIGVRIGATSSNGSTAASGVRGRFNVYGASLETRVALTRTLAAVAGYVFYHHRYPDSDALPTGFPTEYDRHAVRVGITLVLPLVGTSSKSPLNPR